MRLVSTRQVEASQALGEQFDLVLCASGYESRATHVARRVDVASIKRRVAIGFADRNVLSREANDAYFASHGFETPGSPGSDGRVIGDAIVRALRESNGVQLKVLVDFTSMTRVWYGTVMSVLREAEVSCDRVLVTFAYSPSVYTAPHEPGPNVHIGPVSGFSRLQLPDRKSALVLSLGYERERALGLTEYVEAAETFAFIAKPSSDERFVEDVLTNNAQLLRDLGGNRVFFHPFDDLQATSARLLSLVTGLYARNYRVILAPLGPKPFALICLLLATRFPEFDVWRVSQGESEQPYDREPLGSVITCVAEFVSSRIAADYELSMFTGQGRTAGEDVGPDMNARELVKERG